MLRAGGLCAFPTETVYGLGADARSDRAVAAIYAAKARPQFNPLIVHVASAGLAGELADLGDVGARLAAAFWPGPLTLVAPLRPGSGLSALVTAGLPTVALRVPAHALARDLLQTAGIPVAAPSANPSGQLSPTRAAHVLAGLGGRIDAVLDGGNCAVGLESTIVDISGPPRILRPGGLPAEAIAAALGHGIALSTAAGPDGPTAPGQLRSHYAPRAALRLNVTTPAPDEMLLGFGPVTADLNLSPGGDLTEAAANLFHALRELDGRASRIAVSPIPATGVGLAINDRLERAAAPRPAPGGGHGVSR